MFGTEEMQAKTKDRTQYQMWMGNKSRFWSVFFSRGKMCLQNVYERHQRARKKAGGAFSPQKLTLIVYVYENEMTENSV